MTARIHVMAQFLGVSERTLRRWARSEGIAFAKDSRGIHHISVPQALALEKKMRMRSKARPDWASLEELLGGISGDGDRGLLQ